MLAIHTATGPARAPRSNNKKPQGHGHHEPTASFEMIDRNVMFWPQLGRLLSLFLLWAGVAGANVCSPLNVPANGPFPAVVNGVDGVDWGVARIQWTSDASATTPATQQQITYATAAEWAAHPGVYPHETGVADTYVTASNAVQGGILSNLFPSTTYHVLGQSYQGSAWCTASDITLTTLARPAVTPLPVLPQSVNVTQPTMNGTHWVYGSNCGTSGTTTQKVQDCLNQARPGDDIGFAPGTYSISQVFTPNNPNSVSITCTMTGNTCTQTGTAPANGTQVTFFQPPSPVNPGIPYKIINASGSTFQISFDGVNPITFLNAGGSPIYYTAWPLTQLPIVIHSTAAANLLPPAGVRLGPDALAQYLPNMPNFQLIDPLLGSIINFNYTSSGYWFQNIALSTDPSVAANTNPLDPIGYISYLQTLPTNSGITFNQCAFVPAPPPSRSKFISWNGSNMAVINSYQSGLDWWQPHLKTSAYVSVTSTSMTIPALTFSWVTSGGPVGTKKSCTNPGGVITLTGGSASGNFYVWMNADCSLTAQFPSGTTATASTGSNISIATAASPAFPTYTYTSPTYSYVTRNAYTVVPFVYATMASGAITTTNAQIAGNQEVDPGSSLQALESGDGFYMGTPGPFYFDNNYHQGAGIAGVFSSDDLTNGTSPCGWVNPCPIQHNTGNLTQTRSTVTTNPCFFYDAACWNGGNYYWRNVNEVKQAKYVLQDGNIFGPYSAQVGEGECGLHETFSEHTLTFGYPPYDDSSEWTFTNNTCYQMASAGITTSFYFYMPVGMPIKDLLVRNNLFLNNNGYAQVSANQPFASSKLILSNTTNNCPYGHLTNWGGNGQNFVMDHNTVWGQGGCLPLLQWVSFTLSSGITLSNNVFNLVNDPGPEGSLYTTGTFYRAYNDSDYCTLTQGNTFFGCLNNFNWSKNLLLATWTNSFPGSQTEFTSSQIASIQSSLPASSYWPNANTLAGRTAQIGWLNPSTANLRLANSSPYISGAKASTDGADIGANIDQLEQHQGKVSNVRALGSTGTSTIIAFYAPDSFACSVDWGTTQFWNGSGTWTRVTGTGGQRVQSVSLTGLPAHGLVYYRLNCAVQQPTGSVQLP